MDPAPENADIGYLLTAYADGALAPEGAAWVESRLAASAELRARLAEIHRLRAGLAAKLPTAPRALGESRNDALLAAAAGALHGRRPAPRRRWFLATGLAGVFGVLPIAIIVWILRLPMHKVIETLGQQGEPPVTVAAIEQPPMSDADSAQGEYDRGELSDELQVAANEGRKDEVARRGDESFEREKSQSTVDGRMYRFSAPVPAPAPAAAAEARPIELPASTPVPAQPQSPQFAAKPAPVDRRREVDAKPAGRYGGGRVKAERRVIEPAKTLADEEAGEVAQVMSSDQPYAKEARKDDRSLGATSAKRPQGALRDSKQQDQLKAGVQDQQQDIAKKVDTPANGLKLNAHEGPADRQAVENKGKTTSAQHSAYVVDAADAGKLGAAAASEPIVGGKPGEATRTITTGVDRLAQLDLEAGVPADAASATSDLDAPMERSVSEDDYDGQALAGNEAVADSTLETATKELQKSIQKIPARKRSELAKRRTVERLDRLKDQSVAEEAVAGELEEAAEGLATAQDTLRQESPEARSPQALDPQALAERLAQANPIKAAADGASLARDVGGFTGVPMVCGDDAARRADLRLGGDAAIGRALLVTARRAGLQLRLDTGVVALAAPIPLDPTQSYGIAPDAFRAAFGTRPMTATADDAASTFALDQDTASYDQAKAALQAGRAPEALAIQVEHFVNAMPMDYPAATGPEAFSVFAEAGPSPFASGPLAERTYLLSIGVVAKPAADDERKPLHLTLAVDCSGSMAQAGGLDAVVAGLDALVRQLRADDRVAVVAFADQARVVLPPTPGDQRERIAAALHSLTPQGETNLAEGLDVAYRLAADALGDGCENRVVVASDGAALDADAATAFAQRAQGWRARGISLVAIGCGADHSATRALETLADHADGQHWQVASVEQACELFTTRLVPARLQLLAKDAKIQVRFDRERVSHFRLIGFEERRLRHQDFRNDAIDAGELAQNTQTTALYEVVLADGGAGPLGEAAVRYFDTRREAVRELPCPLPGSLLAAQASPRLELAACAAEFAELLQAGWWSNVRCGTFAHLRERLARCPHPAAADLLALVDRAIALRLKP